MTYSVRHESFTKSTGNCSSSPFSDEDSWDFSLAAEETMVLDETSCGFFASFRIRP